MDAIADIATAEVLVELEQSLLADGLGEKFFGVWTEREQTRGGNATPPVVVPGAEGGEFLPVAGKRQKAVGEQFLQALLANQRDWARGGW